MAKELIIHPGMPKTGTTTLQNRIFQNHREYLYLGKHNLGSYYTLETNQKEQWLLSFKRNLVVKDLSFFERLDFGALLRDQFGEVYDQHDKLFLSEEDILARCITPGKYGEKVCIGSAYSIFDKLKVLLDNDEFASVKIILVLRNQADLIESFFAEEYYNFRSFLGMETPEEFIDYLFQNGEGDSLFRYSSLIKHIDSLFGEENVMVLPYEKMRIDPEGFMTELSNFMCISQWENTDLIKSIRDNDRNVVDNNGKVAKVLPIRKRLARLKKQLVGDVSTGLGNSFGFLDKFQQDKIIELCEMYKRKVFEYYAEENQRLEKRVKYISDFSYF